MTQVEQLQSMGSDGAKQIIDKIYEIDHFGRIENLFVNNSNIKINTGSVIMTNNALSYIFSRPDSKTYNPDKTTRTRVYVDREYEIKVGESTYNCRLSNQWKKFSQSKMMMGIIHMH